MLHTTSTLLYYVTSLELPLVLEFLSSTALPRHDHDAVTITWAVITMIMTINRKYANRVRATLDALNYPALSTHPASPADRSFVNYI